MDHFTCYVKDWQKVLKLPTFAVRVRWVATGIGSRRGRSGSACQVKANDQKGELRDRGQGEKGEQIGRRSGMRT